MSRLTQVPSLSESVFAYGAVTRCGSSFQRIRLTLSYPFVDGPTTPVGAETPPVWALAFARHYLRNRWFTFFPPGTEMFQFPGLAPSFKEGGTVARVGLPHSDICGSRDICSYPQLFAAYHVLRRLREPRHPSCALLSFLYDLLLGYNRCHIPDFSSAFASASTASSLSDSFL